MFIQNFLTILIASVFCGVSISYIFSLNYFQSFLISFFILFSSFLISYFYSEKIYVKPAMKLNLFGMIISLIFTFLKIPFFPIISIEEIYYYSRARKIFEKKISSEEIGKIAFIFLLVLLVFSVIGILSKNFLLSFLPSILILSFSIPYRNSFGCTLFFYSLFFFSFFIICSIVFMLISIKFLI